MRKLTPTQIANMRQRFKGESDANYGRRMVNTERYIKSKMTGGGPPVGMEPSKAILFFEDLIAKARTDKERAVYEESLAKVKAAAPQWEYDRKARAGVTDMMI